MNTSKQITVMVVLVFIAVLATGAYTLWDPSRATDARATQLQKTVDRGAFTFSQNCRVCHGDAGEGGAASNRLAQAPPLNRPDLQGVKNGAVDEKRVIERTYGPMQALQRSRTTQGGAVLSDERFVYDALGNMLEHTDDATGECHMLYFDERGVSRRYEVSCQDRVWKWWRNEPTFSQRLTGTIAADGRTMESRGEYSQNGAQWEPDLALTYTRAD